MEKYWEFDSKESQEKTLATALHSIQLWLDENRVAPTRIIYWKEEGSRFTVGLQVQPSERLDSFKTWIGTQGYAIREIALF